MRLTTLHEGHWELIGDYPNAIAKPKKKKRLSFLTHPEDRKRFSRWMSGKLAESNDKFLDRTTLTAVWGTLGSKDPETMIFVYEPSTGEINSTLATKTHSHTTLRGRMKTASGRDVRGFWIPSTKTLALYQWHSQFLGPQDPPDKFYNDIAAKLGVNPSSEAVIE